MSPTTRNIHRIVISLPVDLKTAIEEAATRTGQTTSDFVVSALADKAHDVNSRCRRLELSDCDWAIFQAALEEADAEPNEIIGEAAGRYWKSRGGDSG